MEKNVGSADRGVRVALGIGLLAAGAYYQSWWGAVGLIPLITATLGWCPAYVPFGISSCKRGA